MAITITAIISTAALDVAGLDDVARYPDVTRKRWTDRLTACTGTVDALRDLAGELHDRATEGEDGYNHTPRDRRTCRLAVESLRKHYGITPRS